MREKETFVYMKEFDSNNFNDLCRKFYDKTKHSNKFTFQQLCKMFAFDDSQW